MALIKVVDSRGAADIIVHQSSSLSSADLLVHVVETASDATGYDELWHYVEGPSEVATKVHWVNSRCEADLLVCFVRSRESAGWQHGHPYQGRL